MPAIVMLMVKVSLGGMFSTLSGSTEITGSEEAAPESATATMLMMREIIRNIRNTSPFTLFSPSLNSGSALHKLFVRVIYELLLQHWKYACFRNCFLNPSQTSKHGNIAEMPLECVFTLGSFRILYCNPNKKWIGRRRARFLSSSPSHV